MESRPGRIWWSSNDPEDRSPFVIPGALQDRLFQAGFWRTVNAEAGTNFAEHEGDPISPDLSPEIAASIRRFAARYDMTDPLVALLNDLAAYLDEASASGTTAWTDL